MNDPYTEDYFLRGKASGLSLYEDYRWLPDLTIPMARTIRDHLGMKQSDRVLDFGCARGYLVRAFHELGFDMAFGFDVSEWALNNCDEALRGRGFLTSSLPRENGFDWVIAKDVLEHLNTDELCATLGKFVRMTEKGVFIVVPLSEDQSRPNQSTAVNPSRYVVEEYEKDVTHKIRWPLSTWANEIQDAFGVGWAVTAQYRLPGVKDNYAQFEKGNGFITVRRVISPLP